MSYKNEDFTRGAQWYDLILDLGGNRALSDLRRILRPNGTLVLIGGEGGNRWVGGTDRWIQALLMSPFVRHNLRPLSLKPNKIDLLFLKELIEAGKLTPVIDRTYALCEVPDAFRYLEQGHARGKIVITV